MISRRLRYTSPVAEGAAETEKLVCGFEDECEVEYRLGGLRHFD